MTEKLDYSSNRNSIIGKAFIMAIAILPQETQKLIMSGDDGIYDVSLTINEVECSFSHIIKRFSDCIDAEVRREAANMIEERFREKFNLMDGILDDAQRKVKGVFGIIDSEYD